MVEAVIIGAGHNGLAAAIHLASKGWKVAVVERAGEPGGAVKTRELTLPGFRHDIAAMNLSLFAGSPFLAAHRERLHGHGLEFVPARHCFATAFPDGDWLGVSTDIAETTARFSAQDAESWRALVAEFGRDAPHIFGVLGSAMPSWGLVRTLRGLHKAQGLAGIYKLGQLLLASPRDFLDRHFESPKLKAMMAAWGLHLDFPPDQAGGALFPYLESMASQCFGMVIGRGGADTMIRAMTGYLRELGGELILGQAVERIETAGGRATGVLLANGRRIAASRAVIANAHPQLVFGKLVEAEAGYTERIARFRAGPGTMMVHLALDGLPEWSAGAELQRFAYVHLAPSLEMMARVYAEAAAGRLPEEPVLVVGQPGALDPARAPLGKHVLWVQVRVLPAGIDWRARKEAYADDVIDIIEQYAPGLKRQILARAVWSPADLEAENPNLIGGDNLSGSHHLDQNFLFRPVAGYSRYKTPLKGLYMCGAATWPGAGTGAGSGHMLGRMLAG